MSKREAVQAVLYFGDKVAIVKKEGFWRLIKGGMDPGENPTQTLRRELDEEVGLQDVKSIQQVDAGYEYLAGDEHNTVTVLICETSTEELVPDMIEITDYRWVSVQQALDALTFPEEQESLLAAEDARNG